MVAGLSHRRRPAFSIRLLRISANPPAPFRPSRPSLPSRRNPSTGQPDAAAETGRRPAAATRPLPALGGTPAFDNYVAPSTVLPAPLVPRSSRLPARPEPTRPLPRGSARGVEVPYDHRRSIQRRADRFTARSRVCVRDRERDGPPPAMTTASTHGRGWGATRSRHSSPLDGSAPRRASTRRLVSTLGTGLGDAPACARDMRVARSPADAPPLADPIDLWRGCGRSGSSPSCPAARSGRVQIAVLHPAAHSCSTH